MSRQLTSSRRATRRTARAVAGVWPPLPNPRLPATVWAMRKGGGDGGGGPATPAVQFTVTLEAVDHDFGRDAALVR